MHAGGGDHDRLARSGEGATVCHRGVEQCLWRTADSHAAAVPHSALVCQDDAATDEGGTAWRKERIGNSTDRVGADCSGNRIKEESYVTMRRRKQHATGEVSMSTEENKTLIHGFYEEVFNKRNPERIIIGKPGKARALRLPTLPSIGRRNVPPARQARPVAVGRRLRIDEATRSSKSNLPCKIVVRVRAEGSVPTAIQLRRVGHSRRVRISSMKPYKPHANGK